MPSQPLERAAGEPVAPATATEAAPGAERQVRQLTGLADAVVAVTSHRSLPQMLEALVTKARDIVGAHQGVISYTVGDDWAQAITAVSLSEKYAAWADYARPPDGAGIYSHVARTNQPLRLTQAELEAHPLWRAFSGHADEHPPMRGWLAVPFVGRDGRNLGLLQLSDKETAEGPGEFDADDEWVAVQLARLAAVIIENQVAREQLEQSEARYRSLVQAQAHDVFLVDAEGALISDMPTWRALTGQSRDDIRGLGWQSAVHPGDRDRVARTWREAVRTRSVYEVDYRIVRADGADEWLAVRAVPVLRDGRLAEWVGVTRVVTDERLVEQERRRLEEFAARAADRTRVLQQVTGGLTSAVTVADVLDVVVRSSDAVRGLREAQILLYDEPERAVEIHRYDGGRHVRHVVPLAEAAELTDVLATRRATFAGRCPHPPALHGQADDAPVPCGLLPLVTSVDAPFGVLAVTFAPGHGVDDDEKALLEAVAGQCAQALERALLYERTTERARLQEVLSEASHLFSGSLESGEVVARLADVATPTLADWATVQLLGEGARLRLAAVDHAVPARASQLRRLLNWYPVDSQTPGGGAEVVATGRSLELDAVPRELLAGAGGDSDGAQLRVRVLAVPLIARGRTLGALTLVREEARPHTTLEIATAEDLARRAALAMDNAELYAAQRDVAVTLQRSLLPDTLPHDEHLELSVRYLPGARGTEVGGDWYDAIPLPDGRVGLVVGDVMGRGVRAAAVMGQLRAALRSYALEGHMPSQVLHRLEAVADAFGEHQLTTCVYGVYEPAQQRLWLSSAGHPPPVLVRDGVGEFLDVPVGLPLGVGEASYEDLLVPLDASATLLLYTDGLVEQRTLPLGDGLQRLVTVASAASHYALDDMVDDVLAGMGLADEHDDDVALLAVRLPEGRGSTVQRVPERVLELAPTPRASARARGLVQAAFEELDAARGTRTDADVRDTALLLVSELVTNAVLHTGSRLTVTVRFTRDRVHIGVADRSTLLPVLPPLPSDDDVAGEDLPLWLSAEGGRGLRLVAALAEDWGVAAAGDGKRVWFSLRIR